MEVYFLCVIKMCLKTNIILLDFYLLKYILKFLRFCVCNFEIISNSKNMYNCRHSHKICTKYTRKVFQSKD